MTETLKWTTAVPTEAGYYWRKFDDGTNNPVNVPMVVMIIKYPREIRMVLIGDSKTYYILPDPTDTVQWIGPLPQPSEPIFAKKPEPESE